MLPAISSFSSLEMPSITSSPESENHYFIIKFASFSLSYLSFLTATPFWRLQTFLWFILSNRIMLRWKSIILPAFTALIDTDTVFSPRWHVVFNSMGNCFSKYIHVGRKEKREGVLMERFYCHATVHLLRQWFPLKRGISSPHLSVSFGRGEIVTPNKQNLRWDSLPSDWSQSGHRLTLTISKCGAQLRHDRF